MSAARFTLLLVVPALFAQAPVRFDSGTISGLPARNIGSAQMSGRIAALDAVNDGGRLTVFAASASGGVWKSVNAGTSFKPVFDNPAVQSIVSIPVLYAGRAGYAGEDQINFTLPANIPTGCAVTLQFSVGGKLSAPTSISIAPDAGSSACVMPGY